MIHPRLAGRWARVSLLFAALVLWSCGLPAARRPQPSVPVLIHAEYRSGGDAPTGFLVTLYADESIRLFTPRARELWGKLSESDSARLRALVDSVEFKAAYGAEVNGAYKFGCCDAEEIGLAVGTMRAEVGLPVEQAAESPESLRRLLGLLNEIGRGQFGRRWPGLPF